PAMPAQTAVATETLVKIGVGSEAYPAPMRDSARLPLTLPVNPWSVQRGYKSFGINKYSAMDSDVIDQSTSSPRLRGQPSAARSWLKAIELTSRIEADPSRLFADVVEDWSKRQPDRPALISETETFSYRTLAERINRYARWALWRESKLAIPFVSLWRAGRIT